MLKLVQAIRLGDLGIQASAANLLVAFVDGAVVDDIVARRDLAAICLPAGALITTPAGLNR